MKVDVVQAKITIYGYQWGTCSGIENARLGVSKVSLGVQLRYDIVRTVYTCEGWLKAASRVTMSQSSLRIATRSKTSLFHVLAPRADTVPTRVFSKCKGNGIDYL